MHFPLTPHHVQLVAACYPPSAALATVGPDYKPNSQEVSRLTYYASNHPGKIAKLGNELAKRVSADARKARAGNAKARALLLISLNIFKALTTECRRDIALLSTALMSALDTTLGALSYDLEVAAKVASVFTAWATYSDGRLLGVDQSLTRDYVSTMRRFASMCLFDSQKADLEEQNRTRLIGLGALSGAVTSEALYNSSTQFKSQVSAIVPALLLNIIQADITSLDQEAEDNKSHPLLVSAYLADFRSRPTMERRAASIHVHIDGEQGPSMADVAGTALRAFACLLSQANGTQVGYVLQSAFDSLGVHEAWGKTEHCCWLAEKAVEWIQYPYRYAVSTRLIERLMEAQDDEKPSNMHHSLLQMIKAVFTVPTPVVNLSTSDVCSNLVSLIMRRIANDPHDELLPKLVDCISALGTHVYYADQIHDLACEIIARIMAIDNNGLSSRGPGYNRNEGERRIALRCLLAALGGLIRSSNRPHNSLVDGHEGVNDEKSMMAPATSLDEDHLSSSKNSIDTSQKITLPNRTRIPLDVWQDTLSLLCDEDFTVRSDYTRVLLLFIENEIPPDDVALSREEVVDKDGVKRVRHLQEGPFRRAHSIKAILTGDGNVKRFLNALHASLYVLATSPHLGMPMSSPPSPLHSEAEQEIERHEIDPPQVNIIPSTPLNDSHSHGLQEEPTLDQSQGSQASRRKSTAPFSSTRKLVKIRRLLERTIVRSHISNTPTEEQTACLSDYLHILSILRAVHNRAPSRALMKGLPMLLALDSWCDTECDSDKRQAAIKHLVFQLLDQLGIVWECTELVDMAQNVKFINFTGVEEEPEVLFPETEVAVSLSSISALEEERNLSLNSATVINALSQSTNVQLVTGLDESFLRKRLEIPWTPENALRDSVEQTTNADSRPESIRPILKISPGLMHISNLSLQSLTRSNRGVGVNDLRDALEGRGGMSNIALGPGKAPSIASFGAPTYRTVSGESQGVGSISNVSRFNKTRTRALNGESPKEVRDVLDRLGIGSRNASTVVKPPVSLNSSPNNRSMLIPPYKG